MPDKKKSDPPTPLAKWVYEVRTALDLTREEFAERIGSDSGSVVKWENGERRNVRGDKLTRILKIAPPQLAASCPVTSGASGVRGQVLSDPPASGQALHDRLLEDALVAHSDGLDGPSVAAIFKELRNLRGVPVDAAAADAVVAALIRAYLAGQGRGSRR